MIFFGNLVFAFVTMAAVCVIDPGAQGPYDRALLFGAFAAMFHSGWLVRREKR